jgi:predicted glycoside hydrolase/deacetylase ChbG (UPF0249 family)
MSETGNITLVTRGDDAGSCLSANLAILEAVERGVLRNISVMVPASAFEDFAERFRGRKDACLGLHITLNAEWTTPKWGPVLPRAQVPNLLASDGFFPATTTAFVPGEETKRQMVAEVEAQLALARGRGLKISYMDEHMGVGWVGEVRAEFAKIAQREGLRYGDGLKGLPNVEGAPRYGTDPVANVLARLAAAPAGTYMIVTHPGINAPDMQCFLHEGLTPGKVALERDAERRLLCDPRLRTALRKRHARVVRFDELPPAVSAS